MALQKKGWVVRWSAFWGAVMMLFYYFSSYPLAHSLIVDDHVVYAVLLFGLGAFGADQYLQELSVVENNAWLRYVLG
jgi:thiosulfate dehydrogenase [quinone] large subunit